MDLIEPFGSDYTDLVEHISNGLRLISLISGVKTGLRIDEKTTD